MLFKPVAVSALGLVMLTAAASAQDQDQPATGDDDTVVARIDDHEIYLSDVEAAAADLPEQYRQMPFQMIYGPLLDRVIDARLLALEAEEQNLDEAPEVQPALERARASVLSDALMRQRVTEGVTDDKVQALYDERKGDPSFAREEVHARHILLENEEDARAVIDDLEGGADFVELAKERSTGPSAPNGGDLGYFTREQMVPEFAEAAFNLEPGSITEEPVQTQFGWHVIEVLDKRTAEPTFEETAPALRQEVAREVVTELLGDLRDDRTIERFNIDGTPMPEEGAAPQEGATPEAGGAPPQAEQQPGTTQPQQ